MVKTDFIRSTTQLCAESRDLIDRSTVLITGAGVACVVHQDQIDKSREAVAKSREQISRLRSK